MAKTFRIEHNDRFLAAESIGDSGGSPMLLMHGSPGSRIGPRPKGLELDVMGIRLISYDRPGYGDSTPNPGRTVSDTARDAAVIMDYLGVNKFSVIGRSGGGPHALAVAALLSDRVTGVASLSGLAPPDAMGEAWYEGMSEENQRGHRAVNSGGDNANEISLSDHLASLANKVWDRHTALVTSLKESDALSELDRKITNGYMANLMGESHQYGLTDTRLQPNHAGWLEDIRALHKPWGFQVEDIDAPTLVFHGTDDKLSPPLHASWLADHIPNATLALGPGIGHFDARRVTVDSLLWLKKLRQ